MASVRYSPVSKGSVCLTCGDKGENKLLIYCKKCRDSAVHHYCMDDVSPGDDNINWVCWDCALQNRDTKSIPEISSHSEEPAIDPTSRLSQHAVHHLLGDEIGRPPHPVLTSSPRPTLLPQTQFTQSIPSIYSSSHPTSVSFTAPSSSSYPPHDTSAHSPSSQYSPQAFVPTPCCPPMPGSSPSPSNLHSQVPGPSSSPFGEEEHAPEEHRPRRRATRDTTWMLTGPAPGGPEIFDMLPSLGSHIAMDVWNGQERPILKCQNRFTHLKVWSGPTDPIALQYVHQSGLNHLRDCMYRSYNVALVSAFVERWQPDTNSFHMPFGEMTVTLHDVYYILGLLPEGRFVVSPGMSEQMTACCEILGCSYAEIEQQWQAGIKFEYIMDRCTDEDSMEPNLRAAGYLMYLLGCTIFIDKSSDRILPKFADILLQDPSQINQYAWGPAALAYMYRKLGEATRAECRQLSGCPTLLEAWIYEYFPCFRPGQNPAWKEYFPRSQRWKTASRYERTLQKLMEYRLALDRLNVSEVHWTPYGADVGYNVMKTMYHGTIRYDDIIEPYMPDRVLRQFGYVQPIPRDLIVPGRAVRPRTVRGYIAKYLPVEVNWYTPFQSQYLGPIASPSWATTDEYMDWYVKRSHVQVQNPINRPQQEEEEGAREEHINHELITATNVQAAYHLLPSYRDNNVTLEECLELIDQLYDSWLPYINQQRRLRHDSRDSRGGRRVKGGRRPGM